MVDSKDVDEARATRESIKLHIRGLLDRARSSGGESSQATSPVPRAMAGIFAESPNLDATAEKA